MSDLEMDFQTYVAPAYELRAAQRQMIPDLPVLHEVVPIGKPKLVRPKRQAFDFAVELLSRAPKQKDRFLNADEFALLGRHVVAIAKTLGLLGESLAPVNPGDILSRHIEIKREPLGHWNALAQRIQGMFDGPPIAEIAVANAFIYLARKPNGSRSMGVRPLSTSDALIYHAAQMIAKGTTSHTCEDCGGQFLAGGGRGKDKKRSGSRFCSNECRWSHHNEMRKQGK